ncbi:mechanosensitive ion channel family protein [Flocculibacter collagenilyticus]|uniref:mechanosensitive ion channel family protein n=1 Tax=Flocculibacter collagenilyticus TaxID=2744479 RepID=UPI0018F616C0|nr:mechanosensitive ion channel family protein [Flocculibacter collagenilyticus]
MEQLTELYYKMLDVLPLVLLGILILVVFIYVSGPITQWLMRPLSMLSKSQLIQVVMRRALRLLIILIGLYVFLYLAGLTQFAVAIISGTGVMGLILGFAFRDIAENFISSVLLSVQRPFKIGDVIEVQGQTGVIKQVTARATTLVDFDGNHIQIPNATIYKNIIKNFTANPKMRGHFILGIGYDASIKQAQQLAMNILKNHHAVLDEPEPQVLVDNLGSATVNLKIYFWINSESNSILKVGSLLMRLVVREFDKHDISMPDDARERVFPEGVPLITAEQADTNSTSGEKGSNEKNSNEKTNASPKSAATKGDVSDETIKHDQTEQPETDDVSSDTDEIRQQAEQARDPEQGNNIL